LQALFLQGSPGVTTSMEAPMATNPGRRSIIRSKWPVLAVAAFVFARPSVAAGQVAPSAGVSAGPTPACIAIVLPSVQGVDGSAGDVSGALRQLLTSYLTGPSLKAVPLEARLQSQALEEARQKGCDHILTTTLTRRRAGGGLLGKALGQAAGTAAWYVPGVASTGGAMARGAVIAGAQAVSTVASSTKAKDEMRLDYGFSSLDEAATATPVTLKAKAATDGEDLLTPLAEKAAEAVAAALSRK
jgi:hypothetical protein